MPRNGSGSYGLPAGNPVVPSTVISSTWANTTLSDIGTALTQSIANDGQTTPVANLPMATFRHTNVGNAVARTDYAAAGQVQDSVFHWLTSIAGTDTITASITPSPGAYAAGQTFRFVAAGANTTTTPTLNINGLGAKSITKNGTTALSAGDIATGAIVQVIYDGTQFQLLSPAGSIGEFASNSTTGTSLPNNTNTNATSISLTAGDWDVDGVIGILPAGSTTLANIQAGISTTSATMPTAIGGRTIFGPAGAAGVASSVPAPTTRISLSATTTVYLIAFSGVNISTATVDGFIRARRVR